jgi:hypothetical protein
MYSPPIPHAIVILLTLTYFYPLLTVCCALVWYRKHVVFITQFIKAKYFTSTVRDTVKIKTVTYELEYVYDYTTYKIVFPSETSFNGNDLSFVSGDKDITDIIKPYLGPRADWHNQKYTPKMLGYPEITVYDMNMNARTVKEDEIL